MKQINEFFGEMIKKSGINPRRLQVARMREDWTEIAGDSLAPHLQVHSLKNGELRLKASDPSWSHEASMLKENLRKEINQYFDSQLVTSIRIHS